MTITDARRGLRAIRAGLAGYPVSHSLSPRLFAAAAAQCGIECRYELLPLDSEAFDGFVPQAHGQGFHGISVTTPHKRSAFELAVQRSGDCELTGNANLLYFDDAARLCAANTDVGGFSRALVEIHGFEPAGRGAVILGTGSVARSVLLALSRLGCSSALVAGRSRESLDEFMGQAEACRNGMPLRQALIDSEEMREALAGAELLVNCTSAGMAGREDESPLGGFYRVPRGLLAIDLIYHPGVTRFIAQLRNCGARTENGLAMLACQAAEAFGIISGHSADPRMMLASLAGRP